MYRSEWERERETGKLVFVRVFVWKSYVGTHAHKILTTTTIIVVAVIILILFLFPSLFLIWIWWCTWGMVEVETAATTTTISVAAFWPGFWYFLMYIYKHRSTCSTHKAKKEKVTFLLLLLPFFPLCPSVRLPCFVYILLVSYHHLNQKIIETFLWGYILRNISFF